MKELQGGLQTGLIIAIVTILLLLIANFQSLRLALIVLTTIPAALLGVVLALKLTGTTVNIQSYMGAIMAVGVAVANAILLVTFAHRAQLKGMSKREAALESATTRLRPILMTSLAMIAGMIPMALAKSQTSPLAIATIGGLALATVATLLVLPAVYALLASKNAKEASPRFDLQNLHLPRHRPRALLFPSRSGGQGTRRHANGSEEGLQAGRGEVRRQVLFRMPWQPALEGRAQFRDRHSQAG
jgi:predicted RND superfamily exporter protein